MTVLATMRYEELVQRGREAREQADEVQWVEGDLALEVEALPGNERPRDPETGEFLADETKALRRYAEDIDIPYSTVQAYRGTARAWPRSTRVDGASWKAHQALASQEDRFDLLRPGMTVRQAQKIVRDRTAGAHGKPGWHELLGRVGDDLIAAEKHLAKAVEAITYAEPKIQQKAGRYAATAEALAHTLRELEASGVAS